MIDLFLSLIQEPLFFLIPLIALFLRRTLAMSCLTSAYIHRVLGLFALILAGSSSCLADSNLVLTIEDRDIDTSLFASRAKVFPDLNGDGVQDVVIGSPQNDLYGSYAGVLRFISGKDGVLLREISPGRVGEEFGAVFAEIGDIDRDGTADVLTGFLGEHDRDQALPLGQATYARIYSGRTGEILFSYRNNSRRSAMGTMVAGLGDLNLDGYPDFALGGYRNEKSYQKGEVLIYSGKTKKIMRHIVAGPYEQEVGKAISSIGDINGDGVPEYAIGAPSSSFVHFYSGLVDVYDGKSGRKIKRMMENAYTGQNYGGLIGAVGDINSDGVPDFLIASTGIRRNFKLYSGRDFKVLFKAKSPSTFSHNFWGDIDGDGYLEIAVNKKVKEKYNRYYVTDILSLATKRSIFSEPDMQGNLRNGRLLALFPRPSTGIESGLLVTTGVFDRPEAGSALQLVNPQTLEPRWSFESPNSPNGYDFGPIETFDVDNDGILDIAVGDARGAPVSDKRGAIRVYSAQTGKQIYAVYGKSPSTFLGTRVRVAGDVNGDGVPDYSTVNHYFEKGVTTVEDLPYKDAIISGVDGSTIHEVERNFSLRYLNQEVPTLLGDVDGDGCSDIVFLDRSSYPLKQLINCGQVIVPAPVNSTFATYDQVHEIGDVDGDGIIDAIHFSSQNAGMLSRRTFSLLYEIDLGNPKQILPWGDIDQDGGDDFALYYEKNYNTYIDCSGGIKNCGKLRVISGRTGVILREKEIKLAKSDGLKFMPFKYHPNVNAELKKRAMDLNSDGFPDILYINRGSRITDIKGISGRDFEFLKPINLSSLPFPYNNLVEPKFVDALGDTNGDGIPELVVSGEVSLNNFVDYRVSEVLLVINVR